MKFLIMPLLVFMTAQAVAAGGGMLGVNGPGSRDGLQPSASQPEAARAYADPARDCRRHRDRRTGRLVSICR